jgi:hypothetical protein
LDHDSGYVCLQIDLLGASSSMVALTNFPLMQTTVVLGGV